MRFPRSLCARFIPVALVSVLAFLPASGAVLYDESVSGDLGGNQVTPTPVGTLLLGLNLFQGYDSIATDVGAQGDTFSVLLPADLTITSIALTLSNYSGPAQIVATFLGYGPLHIYQRVFAPDTAGVTNFTVPSLVAPRTVGFSTQFASSEPTGVSWQWAITTTSPVPETSSAQLLGAGLAALGVWSRRRRRRG